MPNVRKKLSAILLGELLRLGMNSNDLARASDLPAQTVRDYVNGVAEPPISRAAALERGLKRPPGWITRQLAK